MTSRPTPDTATGATLSAQRRYLPWIIAAAIVGAGGWAALRRNGTAPEGGTAAAAGPQASGPGQPGARPGGGGGRRAQTVSVAAVKRQDVRVTLNAIGNITAANTAVVKAKIEGELKTLHFKEGQAVKAGALLAELDSRAWQIALAQAEGQLARDQAQLQNARLDLTRFRDLLTKDGIAKQQVDTQDAMVRQLEGTVQANQAQVANARLQLSYTRIVAPISGRIGLKQADVGNVLKPGDPLGLLSIAQTQPANVVFAVPDANLPQIQTQLQTGRGLEVEAWDRDQKRRLATGRVASTDNAIDAATGTIKLKASFPNDDQGLFPNQFVNVRLQLGTLKDTLVVPSAAVLRNADGNYVYLLSGDSTVNARPVRVGAAEGDWVSVQGELKAGDRVVTDGSDRLREGSAVELVKPAGPDTRGRKGASAPGGAASGQGSGERGTGGRPAASGASAAGDSPRGSASAPARSL